MKSSQKGMKLNEIRYFRQPRPYTRKRITKRRLLPDFPRLHENSISSPKEQNRRSISARSSERSRDRCITLDRDQRSREIAWISYTSDSENSDDFNGIQEHCRNHGCNTFVETDPEREIFVNFPKPQEREIIMNLLIPHPVPEVDVRAQIESEVKKKSRIEQETRAKNTTTVPQKEVENRKPNVSEKTKVHEEPKKGIATKDRHAKTTNQSNEDSNTDSEKSFWLRYERIRKILDFFGHLLGRRGTVNREKQVSRNAQIHRRVKTTADSSQNGGTNKTIASSLKNRTRRSKYKSTTGKKVLAKQQPEDRVFPDLTKQIMDTRNERLRVTLLEREMRSRKLEEENRYYKKILEDKLKTRQMSSPLH